MAEIELRDLSFRYPGSDEDTLTDLSLDVAKGEAHALLGSSGAGKSTLLNLLSGLLPVAAGRIFFDGVDVGALPPWQRRVTQVFQFPVLYEAMTIAENLAFPMRGSKAEARQARLDDIAARLGIDRLLKARPAELTLVEKQLVAIGKALMRPDVSLVLLDEPLTAAEPEHKWQLRQTLKSLQRDLGATMIYVTHDQTEALTFADRVSVLHEGRILQTATPQVLLERPAHEHVGYFVGSPGMNLVEGEIRNGAWLVNGVQIAGSDDVQTGVSGETAATTGHDDGGMEDGPCRFGFRPEWAELRQDHRGADHGSDAALSASVRGTRTLTTVRERPVGLVMAGLAGVEIVTRQFIDELETGPGRLVLDPARLVCFRDGWRVTANE